MLTVPLNAYRMSLLYRCEVSNASGAKVTSDTVNVIERSVSPDLLTSSMPAMSVVVSMGTAECNNEVVINGESDDIVLSEIEETVDKTEEGLSEGKVNATAVSNDEAEIVTEEKGEEPSQKENIENDD